MPADGSEKLASGVLKMQQSLGIAPGEELDTHGRWILYQQYLKEVGANPLLKLVVQAESDDTLATSLVLAVLEQSRGLGGVEFIDCLREAKSRHFATIRFAEIQVALSQAEVIPDSLLHSWTNWLQLELARSAVRTTVVARLAQLGRTKRVRALANRRLVELTDEP